MSFKKPLPTWKAQGIQPPEHKLEEGWKAQDKPPAGWLNWQANTTYEALKELQDNVVDHRDVTSEPSANGVVRLNEAGKLNEAVLADAEHKEISLKPGVQIVESDHDMPFNVGSIKGRTLVNLLGRKGRFDSLDGWGEYYSVNTLEVGGIVGVNTMKVAVAASSTMGFGIAYTNIFEAGKDYVVVAELKNGNADLVTIGMTGVTDGVQIRDTKKYHPAFFRLRMREGMNPADYRLEIRVWGEVGTHAYVDAVRVYQVTPTEYEAIAMMAPEQVAEKYPYVDSMKNVVNPYAIATGDNLLPPFFEWVPYSNASPFVIEEPYSAYFNSPSTALFTVHCKVSMFPNTRYTLSSDEGRMYIGIVGSDNVTIKRYIASENGGSITFTTPPNTTYAIVQLLNMESYTNIDDPSTHVYGVGRYMFKNAVLTIAPNRPPFTPQSRSMWAAECQLAANPLDGLNADVLYVGDDGLSYVLERWGKNEFDSAWNYSFYQSHSGHKSLFILNGVPSDRIKGGYPIFVKYDGTLLKAAGPTVEADAFSVINWDNGTDGKLGISVSNTNSGWGDAYPPTADEIKAYFLGWKMYTLGDRESLYNGTGTKCWYPITKAKRSEPFDPSVEVRDTSPDYVANNKESWQPYSLQYLKATPTVEPVRNYETGLTICEGSNVVEVGSGIVLRETMKCSIAGNNYTSNDIGSNTPTPLSHRVDHHIEIYENNHLDKLWQFNSTSAYGNEKYYKNISIFDTTAVYHVTYTMLAPTLSAPINGTIATNLRGTVSDLVQRSGDVERRLSVVENQKAEKDNTVVWITPALLNGWTNYGTSTTATAGYTKIGNVVNLKGRMNGTTTADGTILFMLPEGYRPKETLYMNGTWCRIEINANGRISIFGYSGNYITIDSISFIS